MVKNAAPKDPKSVAEQTGSAWCSSLPSIFSNEWISNGHCSVRFGVTALRLYQHAGRVSRLILWHLELQPMALMEDGNLDVTWKFTCDIHQVLMSWNTPISSNFQITTLSWLC
jgi:hypothetical protein